VEQIQNNSCQCYEHNVYYSEQMRIDRIELIGFKSFAEKTAFNFHPGITCIVGPNGCGKSNIVDAFRWVLGEQSAKSLRGEKMEEVIFHGSASKKPRGMAEVTMVISGLNTAQPSERDNEDPSDTASVTRRLYRSGDSEYMLNKTQCRLKDVKNLFLDTGLEVKSYSILEQDRIAEILNSKPIERRFLIEEVAGVMKYNVRKKEALSRLESSRANLQRISDIIVEVKKQISFLDRLARKAERYKKLTSEIHSIELKIAKMDYHLLKESFGKIVSEYNSLKEEESAEMAALSKIENETETKRIGLLEKEKILEQIQMKFQNLEREIAELEKNIAVAKTERDNNKEYLAKLYQQKEEYGKKAADLSVRQNELVVNEQNLLSEVDNQKESLREKAELLRSREEELAEKEDLVDGKRHEIFRLSEELSNLRNNQSRIQSTLDGLNRREESSIKDAENLKAMLSEIDTSMKDLESKLLQENNDILLLNEKKGVITNEISSAKTRIESLRDTLSRLKEELASCMSRTESLKEIISEGSARDLLSGDPSLNLLAFISDVIEIDDEYEKAVESVLSEKINSFILPTLNDIENAITNLKKKELGRTAFIPVNPAANFGIAEAPEGSIGKMLDFVRMKEEFARVAESLFGNVFLVKDIKTAMDLVSSGKNLFFVTLDGDVVEPTGTVIAGEVKGIFRRKREIRELQSAIEQTRDRINQIQADLKAVQQAIETKEADLKNIENAVVAKEKEVSLLKLTAENHREERERRSRKLAYIALEMEQTAREKESIEKDIIEKDAEIRLADSKKAELEQQGASLQEEISRRKLSLEQSRGEVTDIRLAIVSLKERVESVGKEKENIVREIAESNRKQEFLSEEISSVQSRISQREAETAANDEKVRSLVSIADEYKKEISGKKEVIDSENQELLHAEQGLKLLRNQITSRSQKISELDIQKAEHKLKMDALSENIRQNYGLAIDVVEVESLTEEDERRLNELKEKIRELGPVNLGTLEEYEELRTRYEFLKNQQEDLNKSIAELEEAITKINITTRKRLREAFEALRTKFSDVFLALFGGGRAELVMTDENNILETGIDIIAQPPGKRLQNINLLSGGEKTLTALSLLFASFLIKPTPLCILDEADSALDEMNTEKFSNILKDFSKDTQFIVVTHNRSTMNVADHIYGITMEEAGSSKVISMQLVEAAA
jgi:chromosome segregation protein